ncbi:MAG: Hsp33 family molecular chaperone HslO [Spirochaetes bacterium]|nr:Hsp33 family molecular chaperone HslO [Spirochaetota bacterium]
MIKKKIFGNTLKEQLKASADDRLYRFIMNGDKVRGVILKGTRMVNEMRANHELGILETVVLGRAYLSAALVSADLKGNDRLSVKVECSGPIKGYNVETNAYNEVRGYLKNISIQLDQPLNDFNLSQFFGAGFLTVTKYLEDSKNPFSGTVILKYGNVAQDMAYYFTSSEQIPTSFNLSIQFDHEGNVTGAGGMFLQAMPGADQADIISLEKIVTGFPSMASAFSEGKTPVGLINELFREYSPVFLADTRVEFFCRCNKELMHHYLSILPKKDIDDILANGPFPVEIRCHNCNTKYYFERDEIEQIRGRIIH